MFYARQKLNSMRYKSFVWEFNPASCTYSCQRSYVAHKYPELAGVELEDMEVNEVVITGKGEFFGPNAYSNWLKLNAEFKTFGPGPFYHPIFTDVTQALMTKLQAEMEPRDDYVVYSFEIIGDSVVHNINTPVVVPVEQSIDPSKTQPGDMVILTGYAYSDSNGSMPRSEYKDGIKYIVTQVNFNGTHPIHCSSLGWCRLQDIKLVNHGNVDKPATGITSDLVVTVKDGDTLSGICNKYGVDWKMVAQYNNMKDPHNISVGQKIRIPSNFITRAPTPTTNASGTKNTGQSWSSVVKNAAGGATGGATHLIN